MINNLRGMALFASVVKHQSFSAAAKDLGITTSAVSQQIRSLEKDLGVTLLHRSTRKLSLTDAGAGFYESCLDMVKAAERGKIRVSQLRDELAGTLRLSTTSELGINHILPALSDWLSAHKELQIHIETSNQDIDMIEDRADIAVQVGADTVCDDKQYYALAKVKQMLVASPHYLSQHTPIKKPQDLAEHQIISVATFKDSQNFELIHAKTGVQHRVHMPSRICTNNILIMRNLAIEAHGLARLVSLDIHHEVTSGQLVEVLPHYQLPTMLLYAVTTKREQHPAKVSRCLDVLTDYFSDMDIAVTNI